MSFAAPASTRLSARDNHLQRPQTTFTMPARSTRALPNSPAADDAHDDCCPATLISRNALVAHLLCLCVFLYWCPPALPNSVPHMHTPAVNKEPQHNNPNNSPLGKGACVLPAVCCMFDAPFAVHSPRCRCCTAALSQKLVVVALQSVPSGLSICAHAAPQTRTPSTHHSV